MNGRFKFFVVFFSTSLVAILLVGAVIGKSAPADEPYKHIAVFTEVVQRIKSEYVEEPDMKSVTLGAVNGMLEAIDPFASYLNAEQFKEWSRKKDLLKGDVGMTLSKRAGYIGIVGAIPGSPAAGAGLSSGDWIEAIKGVATRDMPLAYAEMMLKGEPGTTVDITVLRARRPEPAKITLTRAAISYPPVQSNMMDGQAAYIRPDTLAPGKLPEIVSALDKLQGQGAKRLLLDLRNCSVGTPEEGVELANLFVEKGLLGYTQGQKSPRQNFEANPQKVKSKLPMQIVINRGTANGCEVAAAALLESKRGDVVGERSYGAAAVRRAVTLDDGAAVILSVAKYYSPGGKSIPDNGVTPQTNLLEPEDQVEYDEDGNPIANDKPRDPTSYLHRILTLVKPDEK